MNNSPWGKKSLRFGRKKKRKEDGKADLKERQRLIREYLKANGITKVAAAFAHFE